MEEEPEEATKGEVMSYDGRIIADARVLPLAAESVQCVVTSPPYWGLRDYGNEEQIGLEKTPEAYVDAMRGVFRELWRVLRVDGTCWLNLGDSYSGAGPSGASYQSATTKRRESMGLDGAFRISKSLSARGLTYAEKKPIPAAGLKAKDLCGIPWAVAFALRSDGWYLRRDIIWHKPNPMPESVTDRPTTAHEYIFLLTKSERYYYDSEAIKEQSVYPDGPNSPQSIKSPHGQGFTRSAHMIGTQRNDGDRWRLFDGGVAARGSRNKRSVWTVATKPYPEAHYATFPPELITPCILAGSKPGDFVLDPFAGSNTTGMVAEKYGRRWIACDLGYQHLQEKRLQNVQRVLVEQT